MPVRERHDQISSGKTAGRLSRFKEILENGQKKQAKAPLNSVKKETAKNMKVPEFSYISPDVQLGKDVKISAHVNLYGCSIGDETKIGAFVEIQRGAVIGKRVKVSSHTFICEGITIEDNAFIGHGVIFINDLFPRSTNEDGSMQTSRDWKCIPTLIRRGASIGSNATILCGITVGEGAIVGAGSVVTKDVPERTIVAGNPARVLRKLEFPNTGKT